MKLKLHKIHIFMLLLLALVLCPILGGTCHREGLHNQEPKQEKVNRSLHSVKRNEIPKGNEDLYVLRKDVVSLLKNSSERPCPPCERCPEPSFECKKVPNYSSIAVDEYMPKPVLNDFSTFGQ